MSPDIIDWIMCQRKYQSKRQESNIYKLFSDQNKTINIDDFNRFYSLLRHMNKNWDRYEI